MLDEELQMRNLENQVVEEMSPVKINDSIDNLEEEFEEASKHQTSA
jgi:hypothetical protein